MKDALWPLMRAGLFRLDPEQAHNLSIRALSLGSRPPRAFPPIRVSPSRSPD